MIELWDKEHSAGATSVTKSAKSATDDITDVTDDLTVSKNERLDNVEIVKALFTGLISTLKS